MPRSSVATIIGFLAIGLTPGLASAQLTLGPATLRIGEVEGSASEVLFGAFSAARFKDGRVVVGNSGTAEVRIYDARGGFLKTIGRKGDGPGEFRFLQRVGLIRGDTILAYDTRHGRVTWFSPSGDLLRTVSVQAIESITPDAIAFLSDGRILAHTGFNRIFTKGERRDSVTYLVIERNGKPGATLGRYGGQEEYYLTSPELSMRVPVRFGRNVFASAAGNRIAIGANDQYRIDLFDGERRAVIADPAARSIKVRATDLKAWDQAYLQRTPEQFRKSTAQRIGEVTSRATLPAFESILVARDGSVWVGSAKVPGQKRSWVVRGIDGKRRGTLTLPEHLEPIDADAGWLLARTKDQDGVEQILLHTLGPAKPAR